MMPQPGHFEAPQLLTERLVLRAHDPDDFDEVAAMWRTPEVVRYIGGRPFSAEESWSRLIRYIGHWRAMNFGYWAVCERETGRYMGDAGFAEYRRQIDPPFNGAPEIGWGLMPWAQGQGFASEAVSAVIAWGDAHFETDRTVCMIDPDNSPSIRLAKSCGYLRECEAVYHGVTVVVYARSRSASDQGGVSQRP